MPSASGVYSLPVGYLAVTGGVIQASQHNPPLEDIAAGLTARVMRDGSAPMTGPLKLADGTAAAPALAFASAASTGLFKTTNGYAVTINGTQVAEFGSTGLLSGVVTASIADKAVTLAKLYHPSGPSLLLGTDSNAALVVTGAVSNGGPNLIRLLVASTATFTTGQIKTVSDVLGTTEANGTWTITVIDATHIDLQGSVFANAYVSGGTIGGGVEEIALGSGLAMTANVLSATLSGAVGYISGLTLSTAGSSSTFGISAGAASDRAGGGLMTLAVAITKTTASWVVGSGNGSLDTGAVSINTWYHVYQIKRPDTGVVDILFSLSVSSPTMPANYTLFRRIGAMRTNASSQWVLFTQVGDTFIWSVMFTDAGPGPTTTARAGVTMTVPPGLPVTALFRGVLGSGAAPVALIFTALQESDQVPAGTGPADLAAIAINTAAAGSFARLTDNNGQIGVRSTATSGTETISTYGWIDTRGKN